MKYLYVENDRTCSQQDKAPDSEECKAIDAGDLTVVRVQNGVFQCASVELDEEDEDGEKWSVSSWMNL